MTDDTTLTAEELERVESDPVLTVKDVVEHRENSA